jgi:hypothetical protein
MSLFFTKYEGEAVMRRFLFFCLVVIPAFCVADNEPLPADLAPVPEPPEMPKKVQDDEPMEPDITIIRKEKKTIQEFRRNGKLYMVKVIPDVGPPYYFIDTNGDGKMDVRTNDMDKGLNINQWKLLEWD